MTRPPQPSVVTPTLARIYARQGLTDQARQIYRQLLQQTPGDPALEAALAQLDAQETSASIDGPDAAAADSVVRLALADGAVACSWRVSADGLQGARLLHSDSAALTLRMAVFLGEDSSLHDTQVSGSSGEVALELPVRALFVSAVLGLLSADERFVAIAHAESLNVYGAEVGGARE